MQQFQVPQFIEIEDKIFGPLTVKQFVYVLGGVGLITIVSLLGLPWYIFWPLAGIIGGFFAALGFFTYNGQPFVVLINNVINHITHPRLYIWKRVEHAAAPQQAIIQGAVPLHLPKLNESKLKELSWSLDINEKLKR